MVAAIIKNERNEILCALRSNKMFMPAMWEFPGGKVNNDENYYQAIEREIKEELNCIIKAHNIFAQNIHKYDNFTIKLICINCSIVEGRPMISEHAKIIWLAKEYLSSLKWADADQPIIKQLMNDDFSIRT